MKIHEYQGKEIFRKFGMPTPRGFPAFSVDEAVEAAKKLGGKVWVVKAQIHAGGRGKGGGVKVVKSLDEVKKLSSQILGMQLVTGVTVHRADGTYGNAILTRLPLQGVATFDLSVRTREARGGIRVDLGFQEQVLHIFNVHLGLRSRERAAQVTWLVERHILWDDRTGPRIVIGDLNEWFPGRVGRALRREFTSLRRRLTHPAFMPLWALDRIYWDHAVRGESLRVHRTRLSRVASDHLPLVASLRIRPAPSTG